MKSTEQRHKKETLVQTKFGSFLCIFESNRPEPGFTVTSPAAEGFVTYGPTLAAAKRMAEKGLEFHYECTVLESCAPGRNVLQLAAR